MKQKPDNLKLLESFSLDLKGVFTLADLRGIYPDKHTLTFYRRIKSLEKDGILTRVLKSIYVSKSFDIDVLSQKICPNSYISFENVLAKELVIGTVPKNSVRAAKKGKKREYKFDAKKIIHLGLATHLFFGFKTRQGVNYATKEKAFLDTLYFYNKGVRFYFDIFSDINLEQLNIKLIHKYLKKYKNPKFINFVKNYLNEHSFS
ncbi:MAG: hypothetical protein ABH859_03820 [Pseudomonadota bacterium]